MSAQGNALHHGYGRRRCLYLASTTFFRKVFFTRMPPPRVPPPPRGRLIVFQSRSSTPNVLPEFTRQSFLGQSESAQRYLLALFADFSPSAFNTCTMGSQASSTMSRLKSLFDGLLPVNHKSYRWSSVGTATVGRVDEAREEVDDAEDCEADLANVRHDLADVEGAAF